MGDKGILVPYIALKRCRYDRSGLPGARFFDTWSAFINRWKLLLSPLEERLISLIEPIAKAEGFELVRVRVTGSRDKTVQIMAERPDKTMSAEDCAKLSRALSATFEEEDPIEGRFTLEVSSPGIDRPLTRLSDYEDWQGYEAKIELTQLVEGRKRLRGTLGGVEDGNVLFDIDGETDTALIPYDWIAGGKLMLTDQLISESLKAAKEAAANENGEQDMSNANGAAK